MKPKLMSHLIELTSEVSDGLCKAYCASRLLKKKASEAGLIELAKAANSFSLELCGMFGEQTMICDDEVERLVMRDDAARFFLREVRLLTLEGNDVPQAYAMSSKALTVRGKTVPLSEKAVQYLQRLYDWQREFELECDNELPNHNLTC